MSIARNRLIDASKSKQEEKKPIVLIEGMEFARKEGDTDIILTKIETHYKDKDGKKQKYTDAVIHFSYVGLGGSHFTTHHTEVLRMIHMERWTLKNN